MPISPPKPCTYSGCGALVRGGSGRCAKHPRVAWVKQPNAVKRVTGRQLQPLRHRLLTGNPLCVECERLGRVTLVTQRDHINSFAEGGADDDSSVQGLCRPCHEAKTHGESARGRQRAR